MLESETVRRGLQIIVGNILFDVQPLLSLRHAVYRLLFGLGSDPIISRNVLFIRPHGLGPGEIKLGNRIGINYNTEIDYSGGVEIADDVWISQHVMIHTHEHRVHTRALKKNQPTALIPLQIGQDAWIGAYALIMPTVEYIGRGAIVAAGAVATKNVPDWAIFGGVPARQIGERRPE